MPHGICWICSIMLWAVVANMTSTPVPSGVHVLGDAPVRLEKGAKVDPGVVLDAEAGGDLDRSKRKGPPLGGVGWARTCWSGKHHSRAGCRSGSDIGLTCRVAGETNNSILQGWCNCAHEGHVGDSVLGVWSNLGAHHDQQSVESAEELLFA